MGVASPFQSRKPVRYWLEGLTTSELVHLWDFLSRNLDSTDDNIRQEDHPTADKVRKTLYNSSMPSLSMPEKTEEASGPLSGNKPALGVGLFRHRKASEESNKVFVATTHESQERVSRCHISETPALCDWAFPLGCLETYGRLL